MKHTLKCDPESWQAIYQGVKTCEVRINDRGYQIGDELLLRQTTHNGEDIKSGRAPMIFTGREISVYVQHVLEGYGLQFGHVALSIIRGCP